MAENKISDSLINHQIGFNRRDGYLYFPRLVAAKYQTGPTISHCHEVPTPNFLEIVENLDLRIIVLTRNLLDTLVSRKDMLIRDRWADRFLSYSAMEILVNESEEYQLDVIIDLFAHEFLNFYSSWHQKEIKKRYSPIYITYDEIVEDDAALVGRIARELGVSLDLETVQNLASEIKSSGGINFSKGISGRGAESFTDKQIEKLTRLAKIYNCTDKSYLGF